MKKGLNDRRERTAVLSIGGSLIAPNGLDITYLKKLRRFLLVAIRSGWRFAIFTGGGQLNREYNAALLRIAQIPAADLDWLGIATTQVHAQFVRAMLGRYAHYELIDDPDRPPRTNRPVSVGGGFIPGSSTNLDAVRTANALGIHTVVNLTDIRYVYDSDPKKRQDARSLKSITWAKYLRIIPKKWTPRLSTPFDPVASRLAQKSGITVCIIYGHDLPGVRRAMTGKPFTGTCITPP